MNNKTIIEFGFCRIGRGCYPPRPSASVDNTLLDLQNSSYPTQPHSIIAKYILKQWIALKARSDWLVKLRISFAFYLRQLGKKME